MGYNIFSDDGIKRLFSKIKGGLNSLDLNKVDKETGKSLSTNDLTDELKSGYDNAVTLAHTHDNKNTLDKLSVSESGNLTYDGSEVGAGEAFNTLQSRVDELEVYMEYISDMVYTGEIVAPIETSSDSESINILSDDSGSPIVSERSKEE